MKFATIIILAVLALAAPAAASPSAQLVSPNDGDCIGGSSYPVGGSFTGQWGIGASWDFTVSRADTGEQLFATSSTWHQFVTSMNTTAFPVGVPITMHLSVHALDGEATATSTIMPTYDQQPPGSIDTTEILAVSSTQVWLKHTLASDRGCAGMRGYDVGVRDVADGTVTGAGFDTQGTTTISDPTLQAGHTYDVLPVAQDKNRIAGVTRVTRRVTTPTDYATVLAGRVTRGGLPVFGARVSAPGALSSTMTDANGRYNLRLPFTTTTYQVTFDPGACGVPVYCPESPSVTDAVTTGQYVGRIQAKDRSMP